MLNRSNSIANQMQRAFQLAAIAWSLIAMDVLQRRLTEALRLVPSRIDQSDPRIDIALRHRIIRAALRPQEAELLVAAVNGVPRSKLAAHVGVAENTIKTHVNSLLPKLGAVSLDAAVNDVLRAALEVSLRHELRAGRSASKSTASTTVSTRERVAPRPRGSPRRDSSSSSSSPKTTTRLLHLLAKHREGLGFVRIVKELGIDKERLRRMLALLLKTGEVFKRGERRGTRYLVRERDAEPPPVDADVHGATNPSGSA